MKILIVEDRPEDEELLAVAVKRPARDIEVESLLADDVPQPFSSPRRCMISRHSSDTSAELMSARRQAGPLYVAG